MGTGAALEGLAALGRRHVPRAAAMLAGAFSEDPVFAYLMPEPASRRAAMGLILARIVRIFMATGHVYATSENLEGIVCVHFPEDQRFRPSVLPALAGSLALPFRLMRHVPLRAVIRRARAFSAATNGMRAFIRGLGEHIYIDMIAVDARFRGRKHMSRMMRAVLSEADRLGLRCVLETETETNVQIYRHFGFRLERTVEAVPGRLTYYVMLYDPRGPEGMAAAAHA